jgi:hypothetical protein
MSALGQKQTSGDVRVMSALPPIADIADSDSDVRFVPSDTRRFPPPRTVDHYAGRDDELIPDFVGDASTIRG